MARVTLYIVPKFRTLQEVEDTGGTIVWQPPIPTDNAGRPTKSKNDPGTIVLGEWNEKEKKSLFVREREEIVIRIRSKDGIHATIKAYMKYLVWDMSAAISTTHHFKSDPEKAVIDRFQNWAREKRYFDDINGVSFEEIEPDNAKNFFWSLNESIYLTGVILEDVELMEFIIDQESADIAEAQELMIENEFKRAAEEIESERKFKEGEGNRRKKEQENIAEADLLAKHNDAAIAKDKGLKANEVLQEDELRKIKVAEDKNLKENEVMQFRKQKEIEVENSIKLITKLGEYKSVADQTEVQKAEHLGQVTGTLIIHEAHASGGSKLDDMLLETEIIGNTLNSKNKKEKGGNE